MKIFSHIPNNWQENILYKSYFVLKYTYAIKMTQLTVGKCMYAGMYKGIRQHENTETYSAGV